jgi:hypothetical protein
LKNSFSEPCDGLNNLLTVNHHGCVSSCELSKFNTKWRRVKLFEFIPSHREAKNQHCHEVTPIAWNETV